MSAHNEFREAGSRTTRLRPGGLILAGAILLAGVSGFSVWLACRTVDKNSDIVEQSGAPWPETPWKNARLAVGYVGDESCARCHRDISETFGRHPMGRSLARIAGAPATGATSSDKFTTFDAGSSHFTIEQRDGHVFHRESRSDEQGRILAEVEGEVTYAVGSGSRGISYLVEREGRLYQSPISWFSLKQKWDLSPGYERRNDHFERPIQPQCLFCHSNRVLPVPMTVNRYQEPIFRGLAIGCERCHGPGELHVRGQQEVEGRDLTIVNPRHLEPSLRAAVCEQCHLLGDQRIERPGRSVFDFRPGLPTSDFFAVYERTSKQDAKAVGQVEQMKLSRCYQESKGLLGCTSCHDPHQVPAPEERVAYFRGKCQQCHEQQGCTLPLSQRLAKSTDDFCITCHMPTSTSSDIAHTAITDHRILRIPERQTAESPALADFATPLRLLNGDHLADDQLASLGRELGIALTIEGSGQPESPLVRQLGLRALKLLDQALAERPNDLEVRRMRARALAITGRRRGAIQLQQQILKAVPSYEQVQTEFFQFAIELGEWRLVLAPATEAVALNPSSPELHERLAYLYTQSQDWSGAMREALETLRLNPFRRFARMFLIQTSLHQKDAARAETELATLIKLNPNERDSLEQWFAEKQRSQGH